MQNFRSQNGNILLYILIAIFLIGMLTVALRNNSGQRDDVDKEKMSVKANQVMSYASEVSQAVQSLLNSGVSEADLRFAHPDASTSYGTITTTPANQVFSIKGGKALYRTAPSGVSLVSSRFAYSGNRAMAGVGSAKADLTMAVIVNKEFCTAVNAKLGISTIPTSSTCGDSSAAPEFLGSFTLNKTVAASGITTPIPQICLNCTDRGDYLFLSTVLAR